MSESKVPRKISGPRKVTYVGFEVLIAVVMKSTIVWDIMPCSPLSVNRCFTLVSCSAYFFDPEDGGDMFLWNIGWHSTDYTALYPIRWPHWESNRDLPACSIVPQPATLPHTPTVTLHRIPIYLLSYIILLLQLPVYCVATFFILHQSREEWTYALCSKYAYFSSAFFVIYCSASQTLRLP
jgi:hypothetical protein